MMVNIPKIRGCLLSISTNFNRLSTDQSEKQEADLALPNLTGRKMDLNRIQMVEIFGSVTNYCSLGQILLAKSTELNLLRLLCKKNLGQRPFVRSLQLSGSDCR